VFKNRKKTTKNLNKNCKIKIKRTKRLKEKKYEKMNLFSIKMQGAAPIFIIHENKQMRNLLRKYFIQLKTLKKAKIFSRNPKFQLNRLKAKYRKNKIFKTIKTKRQERIQNKAQQLHAVKKNLAQNFYQLDA
jgi:hypothetical protein